MFAIDPSFQDVIEKSAHELLVWVGFGTIVGLTAKALMPGRDPGGTLVTLCLGVAGAVIGCGTLSFFFSGIRISPVSPWGFVSATGGAFILLGFYRLFGGSVIREVEDRGFLINPPRRRRKAEPRTILSQM